MTDILIVAIVFQFFVILGGSSLFILNKSLSDMLKIESPIRYYFRMMFEMCKIAPYKFLYRLSVILMISTACFFLVSLAGTNEKIKLLTQTSFYRVCAIINLCFDVLPVLFYAFTNNKRSKEPHFVWIREKAHYNLYGRYDKYQ